MLKRVFGISGVAMALTVSVAAAAQLTDLLGTSRMTVLKVDAENSRFLCVEHQRWSSVVKTDLARVGAGDIVRVTRHDRGPARLVLLRTATEEISSPER